MSADRAAVLRDIAAAVLEPEELLDAYAGEGDRRLTVASPPYRGHRGVLTTYRGSYWVREADAVVVLKDWCGLTETVPLDELRGLAAAAGSDARAERLYAALRGQPRAVRDAQRYITRHGAHGGHGLDLVQQQDPEWQALRVRMGAVQAARAAWWSGAPAPVVGEQLDLFGG